MRTLEFLANSCCFALEVIGDVQADVDVSRTLQLDTWPEIGVSDKALSQRALFPRALDVSDAFLQVLQREDVGVSVPNWVKVVSKKPELMFWPWQLKKCLPGQRNADPRWNEYLTQLLDELKFENIQGTVFRHREREIYLSDHIDDLLLVANRANTEEIYTKLSEKADPHRVPMGPWRGRNLADPST
eukprot:s1981_g16.t1